ncbi:hypothetical protein BJ741DRAFT_710404 [Chytriomyces cf. hyalinus JEL632]|nr:hypothetical protein BJ741DRAFT_710404 [Chytriomyces cf. hyalinus JEL632]
MASTLTRSGDHAGNTQLSNNNIVMRENSSRGPRSWSNKIKSLVAPGPNQNASQETFSEDRLGERKRSASESISKWGYKFNLGKKSQDLGSQLETEDVHPVYALVHASEVQPARAFAKAEDAATDTLESNALKDAIEDALNAANNVSDMASSGQENMMSPSKLPSNRDSLNSALKLNNTPTKTLNRFPLRSKLTTQPSTEQLSVHKSAIRHQRAEHDSKYGRSSHAKVSFDLTCDFKEAMDQHATVVLESIQTSSEHAHNIDKNRPIRHGQNPFPVQPALSHLQPITVKNHPLERPVDRQLFSDSSQLANGLESDTSGTGNAMRLVSSDAFECMLGPAEARNEKPRELVLLNGCGNSLAGADSIQTISANIFKVLEPFLKDSEREKQAAAQLLSAQLKDGLAQFELCGIKCSHTSAMVQTIESGTRNALNTSTSAIKRQGLDLSSSQEKLRPTLKFRLAPGIRYASEPESVSGSSCGRVSVAGCSCNGSEETCTENSEEGYLGPKRQSDARLEEAKMTSKLALSRYYSSLEAANAQEQKLADNAETASSTDTLNKMGWNVSSFQTSASAIGRYMEGYPIAKSLAPESGSSATRRKRVGSKKRESNATNIDKGPLLGSDTLDVVRARAASTRSLASNQSMIASVGTLRSRLTSVEPQSE